MPVNMSSGASVRNACSRAQTVRHRTQSPVPQQQPLGSVPTISTRHLNDALTIALPYPHIWNVVWHDTALSANVVERLERLYSLGRPEAAQNGAASTIPGIRQSSRAGEPPLHLLEVQTNEPSTSTAQPAAPSRNASSSGGGPSNHNNNGKDQDFYVNAGVAIRTLREDIPCLFQQDLDYDIYREDIVFRDPRNVFRGMKNYQTIFWSLRFHGRIFFKLLYVEILSIWQPEDKQIKMRWKVHGIPRVPWEAEGQFDGISTFKLDSHGKIYEHQVDNVIFRDNPPLRLPLFARVNLVPGAVSGGGQPCPGACVREPVGAPWWLSSFSWYRLYAAMLLTLAAVRPSASLAGPQETQQVLR